MQGFLPVGIHFAPCFSHLVFHTLFSAQVGPRIWAGLEVAASVLPLQKSAIWERAETKSQVHDGDE